MTKKGSATRRPRAKSLGGGEHSPRRHISASQPGGYLLEPHPELGPFPGDIKLGDSELKPREKASAELEEKCHTPRKGEQRKYPVLETE